MKKYKNTFISSLTLLAIPSITHAQFSNASNLGELINTLVKYSSTLVGLLVIIALVVFFWRIVVSIYSVGSDPGAVKQGKTLLLWGIVALFVMVSVWGLVTFLGQAVGINNGKGAVIPQLEGHSK